MGAENHLPSWQKRGDGGDGEEEREKGGGGEEASSTTTSFTNCNVGVDVRV